METKGKILLILFVTTGFLYYFFLSTPVQDFITAEVTRVIDGDTLELSTGEKVRLLGINTPEKGSTNYLEAKKFTENLVLNKTVRIESFGYDKYDRILAHVFIDDKHLNELILENGLASLYYYEHDQYYNTLASAEESARKKEIGIWKKSQNANCLELIELKYDEGGIRCTSKEILKLKNRCDFDLTFKYKDDATHIYDATIKQSSTLEKNFSCIWNDDGDSLYAWDEQGLLMFYRY